MDKLKVDRDVWIIFGFVPVTAVVIALVFFALDREPPDYGPAYRAAEMYGFTDSSVLGYRAPYIGTPGGCDWHHVISFDMVGTKHDGQPVPFLVCCGAKSKGCTVSSR